MHMLGCGADEGEKGAREAGIMSSIKALIQIYQDKMEGQTT